MSDPKKPNPDPAYSNPWGTQRDNRRGTIMGGDPNNGRPGGPENPKWVDADNSEGKSEKPTLPENADQEAGEQAWRQLGESFGTAAKESSRTHEQPASHIKSKPDDRSK